MRRSLAVSLACVALCARAEAPIEAQLALTSLRPGEKEKWAKAAGPLEEQPLIRAQLDVSADGRTVTGKVAVTVQVRERPLKALPLRCTPNAGTPGQVTLSRALVNGAKVALEQPEPSLYLVRLPAPVPVGERVTVELTLSAKVPAAPPGSDGMAADPSMLSARTADYGAFMAAEESVNLAGLLPVVPPRRADGTFQPGPTGIGDLSLGEPTNYAVSVSAAPGWTVVAGGQALGEVPEPGGKVRFSFGLAAARDFGLLLLKGAEVQRSTVGDVAVEVHCQASEAEACAGVLKLATGALSTLEKKLGRYPWTSFRVAQVRLMGGAGGMEFPALVTVSTGLLRGTTDPMSALGLPQLGAMKALMGNLKPMLEDTLALTVVHEAVHQWIPMQVGSDPILEPVADEALTQALAVETIEAMRGKAAGEAMREQQLRMAYRLHRMMGGEDGPALRPTEAFASNGEYAALVYGKAPLLFDAQRSVVGEAAWGKALRAYVEKHQWKWVEAQTFTDALAAAVPKQAAAVKKLRKHWWEEAHGDEDIGLGDLGAFLGGGLPGAGTGAGMPTGMPAMDPATKAMLEEALRVLSGQ